ncbi:MAG: hypothetical protein MMC33_003869 [Icmadophila ericetorum]|nr:hypothetical protein [Icmadophila ericetorum]
MYVPFSDDTTGYFSVPVHSRSQQASSDRPGPADLLPPSFFQTSNLGILQAAQRTDGPAMDGNRRTAKVERRMRRQTVQTPDDEFVSDKIPPEMDKKTKKAYNEYFSACHTVLKIEELT